MGNAFTAVADNHDAIYYNVAGLNKIDGMYLTFMDPYFGINDITEIQDALEESDDVQKVFGNYELSEELYKKFSDQY